MLQIQLAMSSCEHSSQFVAPFRFHFHFHDPLDTPHKVSGLSPTPVSSRDAYDLRIGGTPSTELVHEFPARIGHDEFYYTSL
jgi:hypothetical protein